MQYKLRIKTINSFEEYVNYTEKYKNKYYFRGQANKRWNITPSLFRKPELVPNEHRSIIKEMKETGLSAISSILRLQHYGSPTRICDLTISPLSALYFSIEDQDQEREDGVIYIFDKEKAIQYSSYELEIFSRALIANDLHLKGLVNEEEDHDLIKTILTKNYIIHYDYQFSYSNRRAILQGGTALLFGFSIDDKGNINRIGEYKLDNLIVEKIIVPSGIKNLIKKRLAEIGFTKEVLYHQFENNSYSNDFNVVCENLEIRQKAFFNKIIAKYRVNTVYFDRDKLELKINNIYKRLLDYYGINSRIWTYFYYDENDLVEKNWICQTEWKESNPCNIKWNSNYFLKRMRYINEQISWNEIIETYSPLIAEVSSFYKEIYDIISSENYSMSIILNKIDEKKNTVKDCSRTIDEIGRGNPEINSFVEAAHNFIKEVEHFIDELSYYGNLGKEEKVLKYFCERIINDCTKSKLILNNESLRLGLDEDSKIIVDSKFR